MYIHICIYIDVYMYMYMYVHIHIYIHVYVYTCIYIHTYILIRAEPMVVKNSLPLNIFVLACILGPTSFNWRVSLTCQKTSQNVAVAFVTWWAFQATTRYRTWVEEKHHEIGLMAEKHRIQAAGGRGPTLKNNHPQSVGFSRGRVHAIKVYD